MEGGLEVDQVPGECRGRGEEVEQTLRTLLASFNNLKFNLGNGNDHIFLCSSFSTYTELQELIERGPIIYNADGSCVNSILGR